MAVMLVYVLRLMSCPLGRLFVSADVYGDAYAYAPRICLLIEGVSYADEVKGVVARVRDVLGKEAQAAKAVLQGHGGIERGIKRLFHGVGVVPIYASGGVHGDIYQGG